MTSTDRHFSLPYAEQLRQADRPYRTRIAALRERGEGDDLERADKLERAIDRIAEVFGK